MWYKLRQKKPSGKMLGDPAPMIAQFPLKVKSLMLLDKYLLM